VKFKVGLLFFVSDINGLLITLLNTDWLLSNQFKFSLTSINSIDSIDSIELSFNISV
jgi:hypothetical protein